MESKLAKNRPTNSTNAKIALITYDDVNNLNFLYRKLLQSNGYQVLFNTNNISGNIGFSDCFFCCWSNSVFIYTKKMLNRRWPIDFFYALHGRLPLVVYYRMLDWQCQTDIVGTLNFTHTHRNLVSLYITEIVLVRMRI